MEIHCITSFSFHLWSFTLICSGLRSGIPKQWGWTAFYWFSNCPLGLSGFWALGSRLQTGHQGPNDATATSDLSKVIVMPNRADVNPRKLWVEVGRKAPYSRTHKGCLSGEKSQRSMWDLDWKYIYWPSTKSGKTYKDMNAWFCTLGRVERTVWQRKVVPVLLLKG